MSVETIPRPTIDHEPAPIVSYDEYRRLCDEMQPDVYRKTGISSVEDYQDTNENESTVYVELEGRRFPLFVPLENAGGYNVEGTEGLTGKENVFALTLPPEFLDAAAIDMDVYLQQLGKDAAVVVQTAVAETQGVKDTFTNKLDGGNWTVQDFLDPRCPEGEQIARISIYAAHFEALDEDGNLIPRNDRTLKELFEDDVAETHITHTELIEAHRITNDDELFEQLWELHDDKFNWLGTYHPVSMQENKEFFRKILSDDRTKSIVRFDTDENGARVPVCHGILMDGIDQVNWINDRFMQDMKDMAVAHDERIQFSYAIASKSTVDEMLHYSKDVMKLNFRLAKRGGGKGMLLIESTTMSSQYIPDLIGKYSREEPNGMTMTSEVEAESGVDYWFLRLEPESNDTI